jgi:hypothetical protein
MVNVVNNTKLLNYEKNILFRVDLDLAWPLNCLELIKVTAQSKIEYLEIIIQPAAINVHTFFKQPW